MRYADLKLNDIVDCESGICVSLWMQGCIFRCNGCHNKSTWDILGGYPVSEDLNKKIINAISANGIERNFSVLGGEPLASFNREYVDEIISEVRNVYPNIKIYLWTGYTIEELRRENDSAINSILSNIDVLIDGRFILEQKDITLKLRGSRNQRILKKGEDF